MNNVFSVVLADKFNFDKSKFDTMRQLFCWFNCFIKMINYFILSVPNHFRLEVCMKSIIVKKKYLHFGHFSLQYSWTVFIQFSLFNEYINLKTPSIQSQFGMTEIQHSPTPQPLHLYLDLVCCVWVGTYKNRLYSK